MSCKIDNGSRNWRGMAPRPSRKSSNCAHRFESSRRFTCGCCSRALRTAKRLQSREKIGELRADGSKREPLECAPLRFDDDLRARARVREQLLGDCAELIDRPTGAARARKCRSEERRVGKECRSR